MEDAAGIKENWERAKDGMEKKKMCMNIDCSRF
jgi:hypothetical protein